MKRITLILAVLALVGLTATAQAGQKIAGTFNGTGAQLTIGIGFVPDYVKVVNCEGATLLKIEWSSYMRSVENGGGIMSTGQIAGGSVAYTNGAGIRIYRGGDQMSTASVAYLVRVADTDERDSGSGDTVTTWTLGTNAHGSFNAEPSTSLVGEGSRINVAGKWATIRSMTAATTANGVLLDEALASGEVYALGPMYDFAGAPADTTMPAGFIIDNTTVTASGELCFFEAGTYD